MAQEKEPSVRALGSEPLGLLAAASGSALYSAFSAAGKPERLLDEARREVDQPADRGGNFRRVGLGGTECRPANAASAAAFADIVADLGRSAYEQQGARAFDSTRRAAALHEGGHVVEAELIGRPARSARIRRRWLGGRAQWLGRTDYDYPASVLTSPTSSIGDDITSGRLEIAGVVAELLFDPDFRSGSSLDEIATLNIIVANAAAKLAVPAENLFFGIVGRVGEDLVRNSAAVLAIAGRLERQNTLGGLALRALLRGVGP